MSSAVLKAATWPRERVQENGLIVIGARDVNPAGQGHIELSRARSLGDFLEPGDLLVVNDAATFPGSLHGRDPRGQEVELRLVQELGARTWLAAILGPGDWRQKTEERPDPGPLAVGERLRLAGGISVRITALRTPRLIEIEFVELRSEEVWEAIYRLAQPIQYSYLRGELPLWAVQTAYASRPWAAEMPSAGYALRWEQLLALRARGVGVAWLTHATGISSSGDVETDRRLPVAERYLIPTETVAAIGRARRVIAVGTSVVRALEGCRLRNQRLTAGEGMTALRLGPHFKPRVVHGLLTGLHELGESHFRLLEAFAPRERLEAALELARVHGLRSHEFGDSCLILPKG